MKKRMMSLFLALCLCLTLLPSVALAAAGVPYYDPTQPAGNETQDCATYTEATSETKTWSAGWYVVNHNVTIDGTLTFTGDVHLILCDGATLTVTGGIDGSADASLSIYGQTNGTGELKVTGAYQPDTITYDGVNISGSLTVNGGKLTVTPPSLTLTTTGYMSICDLRVGGKLTVNRGRITVQGGAVTSNGQINAPSILCTKLDMIDGEIEAYGRSITVTASDTGSDLSSYGIYGGTSSGISVEGTSVLTMTGGKLMAVGGTVNTTGSCRGASSQSYGVMANTVNVGGGTLIATGSNASVNVTNNNTCSVYSYGICANDSLTMTDGSITATNGVASCDNLSLALQSVEAYDVNTDSLTVSGGTIKLKNSYLGNIFALNSVKLADLLAEGYAYGKIEWVFDNVNYQLTKTDAGLLLLNGLTELRGAYIEGENANSGHYYVVKLCDHSPETVVCEYCGKGLSTSDETGETGEANDLAWLLPVIGALDKEPFDDVKFSDWFYDDVNYVYEYGLMTGTASRTFSPDAPVTRGMVMTILARKEGIKTDRYSPWYAAGVEWAVANGISDGSNPEAEITREELATMLYRYAKLKGYDLSGVALTGYADAGSVSTYATSAMQWAVGSGLMNGSNGKLTPRDTATRAQLAAMLHRFFG